MESGIKPMSVLAVKGVMTEVTEFPGNGARARPGNIGMKGQGI